MPADGFVFGKTDGVGAPARRSGFVLGVIIVFSSTFGVNAPTFVIMTDSAYSVTITHTQVPGMICGMAVGVPNPVEPTAGEGEPACK